MLAYRFRLAADRLAPLTALAADFGRRYVQAWREALARPERHMPDLRISLPLEWKPRPQPVYVRYLDDLRVPRYYFERQAA